MKKFYFLLALVFLSTTTEINAAVASSASKIDLDTTTLESGEMNGPEMNEAWKDLSRKEKRAFRKGLKKDLKEAMKKRGTETLLLVIIAVILPPLAMALFDGLTNRFWLSLLLTLLFYLPGLIYTLVVILGGSPRN